MKPSLAFFLFVCTVFFTACGSEDDITTVTFNSSVVQDAPDFFDERDSTTYRCVRIGNQIWMAENLRYHLPGYSLDGSFTWGEQAARASDIKPADTLTINFIRDIANDPQYEGWPLEKYGGIKGSLIILSYLDQYDAGRMTIKDIVSTIAMLSPEFSALLNERLAEYARLPAARAAAGRANFEKYEKLNGGYVARYGCLYTFAGAVAAVPEGWRLPSDDDWKQLEITLGLSAAEAELTNEWRGEGLAALLAEGGAAHFDAQFGGGNVYQRANSDKFMGKDQNWYYWSSTQITTADSIDMALFRMSATYSNKVWRGTTRLANSYRNVLYSVRCVKDAIKD